MIVKELSALLEIVQEIQHGVASQLREETGPSSEEDVFFEASGSRTSSSATPERGRSSEKSAERATT